MRGFLIAAWLTTQAVWLQAAGFLAWTCLSMGLPGALPGLLFTGLFGLIGWRMYRVAAGRGPDEGELGRQAIGSFVLQMALGGLLAVALPGFADLYRVMADGALKRQLGEVRAALDAHQKTKGPPASLEELVAAGALPRLPELARHHSLRPHPATRAAFVAGPGSAADTGRWGYAVGASSATVFIDCTHTDSRGNQWRSY